MLIKKKFYGTVFEPWFFEVLYEHDHILSSMSRVASIFMKHVIAQMKGHLMYYNFVLAYHLVKAKD